MEFSPSWALSVESFERESPDAGDVDMKLLSPKGSSKPKRARLRQDVHLAEGGTESSRSEIGGALLQKSSGSMSESRSTSKEGLLRGAGIEDDEIEHESRGA